MRAIPLLLWTLLGEAQAACYQLPFSNPDLDDGWGSTCCGRTSPHRGLDFPQPEGTPIPAVSNGVVVASTYWDCLGWAMEIRHDDGWYSGYGHMYVQSPIPVGTYVTIGQTIGYTGNTGSCTTGPHLHLTIGDHADAYASGTTVDPYAFIVDHGATSESCNGQDDDCDAGVDEGDLCEIELLQRESVAYAPPTTTDVNGDGRVDICALEADGLRCWPATTTGWDPPWPAIPWTTAAGFGEPSRFATLRMGDLDGDGLADACIRAVDGISCARSTGTSFDPARLWLPGFADADGWSEPSHYTTLRLADVDGDGRDDLCARDEAGLDCWRSSGFDFGAPLTGPRWSDAEGFDRPWNYGTLRLGDIDGDHKADACIRSAAGFSCLRSDGEGFSRPFLGPNWSDAAGYTARAYWSTLRLADVNGDGRQDACIRSSVDLSCALAESEAFGERRIVAGLADAAGWADLSNYGTLRAGDISGDGIDDLCARADAYVACWVWDGAAFVVREGPALADTSGWASPQYYETLRVTDWNGDGAADLCARASDGWRCYPAADTTFGEAITLGAPTDASGGAETRTWATMQSGGRSCGTPGALPCPTFALDTGGEGSPAGRPGAPPGAQMVPWDATAAPCGCAQSPRSAFTLAPLGLLFLRRRRPRSTPRR